MEFEIVFAIVVHIIRRKVLQSSNKPLNLEVRLAYLNTVKYFGDFNAIIVMKTL